MTVNLLWPIGILVFSIKRCSFSLEICLVQIFSDAISFVSRNISKFVLLPIPVFFFLLFFNLVIYC